jgi:hypothetical protein
MLATCDPVGTIPPLSLLLSNQDPSVSTTLQLLPSPNLAPPVPSSPLLYLRIFYCSWLSFSCRMGVTGWLDGKDALHSPGPTEWALFPSEKTCFYQRNGQRPFSGTRVERCHSGEGKRPLVSVNKHPKAGPTCCSFVGAEGMEPYYKVRRVERTPRSGPPSCR